MSEPPLLPTGNPASEIEITGPGPHDGMRLHVPGEVVALVTITRRGDAYAATWSKRRRDDIDDQRCADALRDLLIEAGWPL